MMTASYIRQKRVTRMLAMQGGPWLAGWLNDQHCTDQGRTRVTSIINLLRKLERGRLDLIHNPVPEKISALVRLEVRLRDITGGYITHPYFALWPHPSRPEAIPLTRIRLHHAFNLAGPGQISDDESRALRVMDELIYSGLFFERLKMCEGCARWVFYKKSGGRFCERKKCKNFFYESDPERQARKRRNSKKNYDAAKERERRNLERVKRGNPQ